MTIITTSVPEHSLRHELPNTVTNSPADAVADSGKAETSTSKPDHSATHNSVFFRSPYTESAVRAWASTPDDTPPLTWWRTLPSDAFHEAEYLRLLVTLEQITVLHRSAGFAAALNGDPAAAIDLAFSLMPIGEMTVTTDIAMSALLRCALEHNASAALVLAQVVGLTDLSHTRATELAASWFTYGLRNSTDPRKFVEAETVLLAASREHRGDGDHV